MPELVAAGASAVELMVAPALMVASNSIPGTPEHWRELPPESAALLVEFRSDDAADLDGLIAGATEVLAAHETIRPFEFTRDRDTVEMHWRVREGMFGLVGVVRPPGSQLITEDVCVPPERIAESARDIQALLGKHGFLPGVAGHASAGNLHFMLTPSFTEAADRERYEAFIARAGRADRRQVRRLAEGRARDGAQHGPLRRARVGGEGDGDDVEGEAARRPATACSPPGSCSTATPASTSAASSRARRSRTRSAPASSAGCASPSARAGP